MQLPRFNVVLKKKADSEDVCYLYLRCMLKATIAFLFKRRDKVFYCMVTVSVEALQETACVSFLKVQHPYLEKQKSKDKKTGLEKRVNMFILWVSFRILKRH